MARLPVLGPWSGTPELTAAPGRAGSMQGVHLYRATLEAADVVTVDGTPTTSPARTLIDLARHRPLPAAVAALDAGLNRRLVTAAELDDVVRRCRNWPGIRRAQRALDVTDPRAESPLESVSRLVLARLGLPPPETQLVVFDPYGQVLARLDFSWDEFGVAGEADGAMKYTSARGVPEEKERQELVESYGVVFARWGWEHVTSRPLELRRRVEAAFERGRLRDRSGFRREWSVGHLEPTIRRAT